MKNNTNDFDFISSLHNSLTNNFKQCKTYETNCKLPLIEKKKNLFILHINIRSIYKNFGALNHELKLFTDESKFNLVYSDGKYYVKCYKAEKFHPQWLKNTARCYGGEVMVAVVFNQVVLVHCVDQVS